MPIPAPGPGQLLLRVQACGVCRTDLHLIDGEVDDRRSRRGSSATRSSARVPWQATRGRHPITTAGASASRGSAGPAANASTARAGGRTSARGRGSPGATSTAAWPSTRVADARYCFPIPRGYPSEQAAPLLCAGLIGYRALRMCGEPPHARPLRLRRGRPHHRPGRRCAGHTGVRLHARGRRRRPRSSPASSAPSGRAPPRRPHPSRWARRSSSRPSASSCRSRCERWRPAGPSSAAGST